jgi:hypothetical protein
LGKTKKGEIYTFGLSKNEQVWISDDLGFIYMLDNDLNIVESDDIKTVYGHPALSIQFSNETEGQQLVAFGDSKGYITVLDAQTKS